MNAAGAPTSERVLRVATALLFLASSALAVARAGGDDEPPLPLGEPPAPTSSTTGTTGTTVAVTGVAEDGPEDPERASRPARPGPAGTGGTGGTSRPTSPTGAQAAGPEQEPVAAPAPTTTTRPPAPFTTAGVYRVRPDGSGLSRLLSGPTAFPTWSPDGTRIAFGAPHLRVGRADGSGVAATVGGRLASAPAWSPDGSRIAYVGESGGHFDLRVAAAGGGDDRIVAGHAEVGEVSGVSWSRNGEPIAFIGGGRLWVVKSDGSDLRQVSDVGNAHRAVSFSPDGRLLAFVAGDTVMVVGLDGGGLRSVGATDARPPAWDDLSWSPDSSRLVFQSGTGGADRVRLVGHDGSNPRMISDDGMSGTFSPDGRRIALYTAGPALGRGDRDNDLVLANPDRAGFSQAVLADQPGAVQTWGPAWSPDGAWILFAVGGTRSAGPPR